MGISENRSDIRVPKILYLEDNPDTLRVLSHYLRMYGYEVREANCIRAARELARQEQFDLAICDVGLPDGTGVEFFEELQTIHPTPGFVISGFGMAEDIRLSLAAGLAEHHVKPISFSLLTSALERVCQMPPPKDLFGEGPFRSRYALAASGVEMLQARSQPMRVLAIFSNPADTTTLRLDREDREISGLARRFREKVEVERQHASDVNDIHSLLASGGFDVIHFSGHGSPNGIYLDRLGQDSGELVDAERVVSLMDLADKAPSLAIFLCCYSDSSIEKLACVAPFVITSRCEVTDEECILFVRGFYELHFGEASIQSSFDHAQALLRAKGLRSDIFRLSRRTFIKSPNSVLVECKAHPYKDSIVVNLDA